MFGLVVSFRKTVVSYGKYYHALRMCYRKDVSCLIETNMKHILSLSLSL